MNRAARRAAGKPKGVSRERENTNLTAAFNTLGICSTTDQANADRLMLAIWSAFHDLAAGSSEVGLIDTLGMHLNVGLIRAEAIAPSLEAVMVAAGDALREAIDIHARHGRYGFSGPGLQAMREGIHAYEAILRASTTAQMRVAHREMQARIRKQLAEAARA